MGFTALCEKKVEVRISPVVNKGFEPIAMRDQHIVYRLTPIHVANAKLHTLYSLRKPFLVSLSELLHFLKRWPSGGAYFLSSCTK